MAAALGLTGCGPPARAPLAACPGRSPQGVASTCDEFVAEHNRNAERDREPRGADPRSIRGHGATPIPRDGHLAMERPRNFKLELPHHGATKADIGSNADEFWFWVANPKQPYSLLVPLRRPESSSLPVTYQPDWIIEALGLKPIPDRGGGDDPRAERDRAGNDDPDLPRRPADQGEPYTREMIVSNSDRRIKELRHLQREARGKA